MSEELIIPMMLTTDDIALEDDLYELSLSLRRELLEKPVDSVVHAHGSKPEAGSKGIGPNETQLLVTLGSQVLPAIILLLSNWLIRQKDQRLHLKIGEAELDIPRGMSPDEVDQFTKIVTRAAKQVK
jgi:hypothetical protein